jgi:hypothetical protein
MKVQTFIGKISNQGVQQMDEQINAWLNRNGIKTEFVSQTVGSPLASENEQVIITSIWYKDPEKE